MLQIAILLFVCVAGFKLIAEYRIGRNEDIAASLCEFIKPHLKFREFYVQTFADCQNENERAGLIESAEVKEREFDLRVSRILAEHASRRDLKVWAIYYKDNPNKPFKHATEAFNQETSVLASRMIENIMETTRHRLTQKDLKNDNI